MVTVERKNIVHWGIWNYEAAGGCCAGHLGVIGGSR